MTSAFRKKIRAALANPTLQAALDANSERRVNAQFQAMASIPSEERGSIRQRARAVREKVVANLDGYLEQLIAKAKANGMIVHRAADGVQAVEIVRQIARQHEAGTIAKSKTMVGEEIQLNQALEAEGIKVVETDLGEYIVQLREEPPSHIITPAVHLTRQDVGHTFAEKLGIAYTDDIPTLTAVARSVLRQTFLEADIGISGVNVGVAESGTLCVVTNEGNGRMCTTLPKIHIALMGIERMVPTLEDLALILELLPRSATGQKLSVYTSLINGPRRNDEIDGALERHLVLIDNGRRALQNSPMVEALYCIRCGACLNACPVFREIGGHAYVGTKGQHTPYPGPIGSAISPGFFGAAAFGNLARASSLCGACKEVCPIEIDLPELLLRVRAGLGMGEKPGQMESAPGLRVRAEGGMGEKRSNAPVGLRVGLSLFTWIATSPGRFTAAQRMAGLFTRMLSPFSEWVRLPAFTGWGYRRDFPRPALTPFHESFAQELSCSSNEEGMVTVKTTDSQALAQPAAPLPAKKEGEGNGSPQTRQSAEGDDIPSLVEQFSAELSTLGGKVTCCDPGEIAKYVLELLKKLDTSAILAWDDAQLPDGLLAELRKGGVKIHHESDPSVRVGLTGALAGIARTGSVVLTSGAGRPLSTSLLPEVHIMVLRKEDIHEDLTGALTLPPIRQASTAVIITGPSRTADIEMSLTIGVHGPGEVHVLVI
jgi:L-lactate dehydrogenase complex protein LldF